MAKPKKRPKRPEFSSGPCAKRPGWTVEALQGALLGKSHRSADGKAKLKAVIDESHAMLGLPSDYVLAIVPGSDTGALEMALWSMLGARGVDILTWENFGKTWAIDVRVLRNSDPSKATSTVLDAFLSSSLCRGGTRQRKPSRQTASLKTMT